MRHVGYLLIGAAVIAAIMLLLLGNNALVFLLLLPGCAASAIAYSIGIGDGGTSLIFIPLLVVEGAFLGITAYGLGGILTELIQSVVTGRRAAESKIDFGRPFPWSVTLS
jgi:hypothetical protein